MIAHAIHHYFQDTGERDMSLLWKRFAYDKINFNIHAEGDIVSQKLKTSAPKTPPLLYRRFDR